MGQMEDAHQEEIASLQYSHAADLLAQHHIDPVPCRIMLYR